MNEYELFNSYFTINKPSTFFKPWDPINSLCSSLSQFYKKEWETQPIFKRFSIWWILRNEETERKIKITFVMCTYVCLQTVEQYLSSIRHHVFMVQFLSSLIYNQILNNTTKRVPSSLLVFYMEQFAHLHNFTNEGQLLKFSPILLLL